MNLSNTPDQANNFARISPVNSPDSPSPVAADQADVARFRRSMDAPGTTHTHDHANGAKHDCSGKEMGKEMAGADRSRFGGDQGEEASMREIMQTLQLIVSMLSELMQMLVQTIGQQDGQNGQQQSAPPPQLPPTPAPQVAPVRMGGSTPFGAGGGIVPVNGLGPGGSAPVGAAAPVATAPVGGAGPVGAPSVGTVGSAGGSQLIPTPTEHVQTFNLGNKPVRIGSDGTASAQEVATAAGTIQNLYQNSATFRNMIDSSPDPSFEVSIGKRGDNTSWGNSQGRVFLNINNISPDNNDTFQSLVAHEFAHASIDIGHGPQIEQIEAATAREA